MGVGPGDRLAVALEGGRLVLRARPKDWVEHYDTALAETVPPKALVKAARDTLSGAAPLDVVLAVALYLDDPRNFRLLGSYRSGALSIPDIDDIVKKKEGDVFDKAVLAHLILESLKVESYLSSPHRDTALPTGGSPTRGGSTPCCLVPSISEDSCGTSPIARSPWAKQVPISPSW
jgi:hypothetical protein